MIITFFVMVILLSAVLAISIILYSEIKVNRNMSQSMVGFYAADAGIEKILYYDRQVRWMEITHKACQQDSDCSAGDVCQNNLCATPSSRGMCTMYVPDINSNPNACVTDQFPDNPNEEHSIYCTPTTDPTNNQGCDPDRCDDCTISFTSFFDNRYYSVTDTVDPSGFTIRSKGTFGTAGRKVEILITSTPPQ